METVVKLNKSPDSPNFGFSVFGGAGLEVPCLIYDIVEGSVAFNSNKLEAGDVIVNVNGIPITNRHKTRDVLKIIRLSNDELTLSVRKDPHMREKLRCRKEHPNEMDMTAPATVPRPTTLGNSTTSSFHKSCSVTTSTITTTTHRNNNNNNNNTSSNNGGHRGVENGRHGHRSTTRNGSCDQRDKMAADLLSSSSSSATSTSTSVARHRKCEAFIMTGDAIIARETSISNDAVKLPLFSSSVPSTPMYRQPPPSHSVPGSAPSHRSMPSTPAEQQPAAQLPAFELPRGRKREGAAPHGPTVDKKSSFHTNPHQVINDTRQQGTATVALINGDSLSDSTEDSSSGTKGPVGLPHTSSHSESSSRRVSDAEGTSELMSAFGSEEADRFHASSLEIDSPTENVSPGDEFSKEDDWILEPDLSESQLRNALLDGSLCSLRTSGSRHSDMGKRFSGGSFGDGKSAKDSKSPSPNTSPEKKRLLGPQQQSCETETDAQMVCSPEDDDESLKSFHGAPVKAIDMPSALRLAKRLYLLEGFKKADVSRHLSKNNEFARVVAEEYLKYFDFTDLPLDVALRKFLSRFCLIGETQERERVLDHFSKRYLDCNRGSFKSADAVHTLTCALMLLNTDLHSDNMSHRMTCLQFIDNLADLNEGENFPKDILKALYHSIKNSPLEWATDDSGVQTESEDGAESSSPQHPPLVSTLPEIPNPSSATEYKRGVVMRKCCIDPNGKKTPLGKRGWKMVFATLCDMVLYMTKDEHQRSGKNAKNGGGIAENATCYHSAIRVHHALATRAADYTKKQNVFRLQTCDRAEYLFQASDPVDLQSWIDTINTVAATLSATMLPPAVGRENKFYRPLYPISHTKFSLREQLESHDARIVSLERELEDHVARGQRDRRYRQMHDFHEKHAFLQYELKRFKTYAYVIRCRMANSSSTSMERQHNVMETCIGEEGSAASSAPRSAPHGSPNFTTHPPPASSSISASTTTAASSHKHHRSSPRRC